MTEVVVVSGYSSEMRWDSTPKLFCLSIGISPVLERAEGEAFGHSGQLFAAF